MNKPTFQLKPLGAALRLKTTIQRNIHKQLYNSLSQSTSHTGAHLMQPSSEAYEAEDRCFRVSVARRLMLSHPAAPNAADVVQSCTKKVQRASSATNQWTRNSTTATAVGMEEVLIAGMQQWRDALQTSYNRIVASRYSLNRKYLLSRVLSTDRLNMLVWILSLTSTVQSRIWVYPLLLLSLAVRPWSLLPTQKHDLWPRERSITHSTGIH